MYRPWGEETIGEIYSPEGQQRSSGRVDSYLVESGLYEVGSFCSIKGYRFWLGEVSRVEVDFLELEIESPLDFERVGSIQVPDSCFLQTSLFSFPSQV